MEHVRVHCTVQAVRLDRGGSRRHGREHTVAPARGRRRARDQREMKMGLKSKRV